MNPQCCAAPQSQICMHWVSFRSHFGTSGSSQFKKCFSRSCRRCFVTCSASGYMGEESQELLKNAWLGGKNGSFGALADSIPTTGRSAPKTRITYANLVEVRGYQTYWLGCLQPWPTPFHSRSTATCMPVLRIVLLHELAHQRNNSENL